MKNKPVPVTTDQIYDTLQVIESVLSQLREQVAMILARLTADEE